MYGNFPNEKFLLIYGFTVAENPFDAVQIYAPISVTDPLYNDKAQLLSTMCGIEDVNRPHMLLKERIGSHILPESLLSVLRVVGIQSEEELETIVANNNGGGDGVIRMISPENEQAALSALGQALHTMARQLALNMISDDNLQAASNLQPVRLGLSPVAEERGSDDGDDDDEDSSAVNHGPSKKQSEALQASEKRTETGGVNLANIKRLCQSEYAILQATLTEVSERLEQLRSDTPISTVTGQ
jgi:hypothetical protein